MIILALILILILLLLVCLRPLIYYDYKIYKAYRQFQQKIFYNAFIRYALQSSLKLEMAAASSLYIIYTAFSAIDKSDDKDAEKIGSNYQVISSCLILGVSFVLPLLFGLILYRNYENLPYTSVKNRLGSMYQGCKTEMVASLAYSVIFLYRRIIFVSATFLLRPYPSLQVTVLVNLNLAYLCYLVHVMPLEDKMQLNLEILTEMMFAVVCLHLFWFQDPFAERPTRHAMGKSMICLILAMILVTFSIVLG